LVAELDAAGVESLEDFLSKESFFLTGEAGDEEGREEMCLCNQPESRYFRGFGALGKVGWPSLKCTGRNGSPRREKNLLSTSPKKAGGSITPSDRRSKWKSWSKCPY
jgi:hypothetical protein